MCTYRSQKYFLFFFLLSAHETRQILVPRKVAVVAWILHVQEIDMLVLLVTGEPQRKNLFIFDAIHVD